MMNPELELSQRIKWVTKIQGFYFEITRRFKVACDDHCKNKKEKTLFGDAPKLWKTIGDEAVFFKEITDHRQVAITLHLWLEVLSEVREFLNKDGSPLDIKSTSWLAGFPFANSEVLVDSDGSIPPDADGDYLVEPGKMLDEIYHDRAPPSHRIDFIGPSIDIGFRLSALSSKRKLMISVDVAYVLSLSAPGDFENSPVFTIFYDGPKVLKGVIGGREYPAFWIDLSDDSSVDRLEDKLANRSAPSRDNIRAFCVRFYDEHKSFVFRPFIDNQKEQILNDRPSWYNKKLEALRKVATYEPDKERTVTGPVVQLNPETLRQIQEMAKRWTQTFAAVHLAADASEPQSSTRKPPVNKK